MTPRFKLCGLLVIVGALVIKPMSVAAHAYAISEKAFPAPNAVLDEPPESICIEFSGLIQPELSWVKVAKTGFSEIPIQRDIFSSDGRTLCAKLPRLLHSDYRVNWSVVGLDGHRTKGHYSFQVR